MKIRTAVAILGLLLVACAPKPGTNVHIKNENAIGCRVFASYAGEWTDCIPLPRETRGIVANHPEIGSELAGRVRVVFNGYGPFWMNPNNLEVEK